MKAASAFDIQKVLAYESNRDLLRGAGFEVTEHQEREPREWVRGLLERAAQSLDSQMRIAVDCSSFSRSRLAELLLGITDFASEGSLHVDFLYAPAEYVPYREGDAEIRVLAPVTPEFAGWAHSPDAPVSCVVGLGYEPDRAVGALEYLEPACVWVFSPRGIDGRYDCEVTVANQQVEDALPYPTVVEYSVLNPFLTFVELESLAYGLKGSTRPILVPFGPKIFTVVCLLVGLLYPEQISVWRVSGTCTEQPVDRRAQGKWCSISVVFGPA